MQQLYDVSERFSRSLDEVRGPDRKKHYFKQAQAWIRSSSARRALVRGIGYGGISLLVGVVGFNLYRNRNQIRKSGLNFMKQPQTNRELPTQEQALNRITANRMTERPIKRQAG